MNIYMIILKRQTSIDKSCISEKIDKEVIIGNMDTALQTYSELKEKAQEMVKVVGVTASIALFCPIIHVSGLLLERPKNSDYIKIANFT